MSMGKNKILSKLNIRDYNNELEKILENKLFSYDVKNLLLSMLYKIENAYRDYETVKVEVPSKKEFIENILRIIREKALKTAAEDAKRLSNNRNALNRINGAKKTLLGKLEMLAAAEAMKLKSLNVDDVFSEKCESLSKGYQGIKNYCNKRAKAF